MSFVISLCIGCLLGGIIGLILVELDRRGDL